MGIFFGVLGQLFVKYSSKPLEKMLKETSWSCREVSGSTGQAEWKMTPVRSSGLVVLGSEPRPRIAKEIPGKSRETQSSKVIWEQIFPNAKTSYAGYGLGGGEVASSSPWAPVSSFGCGLCDTQSCRGWSSHAYNSSHGVGMVTAPCRYSLRLAFQVISSFTSYGLILKGFSVIGLSLAMFNPLIFLTCIRLLRGKANSGWQWKRDHIQIVIVSMSKTKA